VPEGGLEPPALRL